MPRRRPPGEGHVLNNIVLFAAAIFFLPWLVDAQQQQRHESPHEGREQNNAASTLEVTKVAHSHSVKTPLTYGRRKNTLININDKNDASAIATLAPAETAVAAPSPRKPTVGLSPPQIARNLGDWEVEDFVLLATVDGKLHARDRKTGKERWDLSYEQPMVHTQYHPRNQSVERGFDPTAIDSYLWIVEPSRDGTLYIYRPDGPSPGLVNTGLTMKKLVEEMSPYGDEDPPVMYTGEKKTNLVTVDANTGRVLSWFGTVGSIVEPSCILDTEDDGEESERCPKVATLTIGRTEYTVAIHGRKDGHHIATLTFSEWSPNNYDQDLQRQYSQSATTLDNKYIYTGHDGGVIGFDHDRGNGISEPRLLFNSKLSSPVVRVFDIARPWGTDKNAPDLIILPQPPPPDQEDKVSAYTRASSIFLNQTEDGSWFAMSGKSYPLAIGGIKPAKSTDKTWLRQHPRWDIMNKTELADALIGLHSIDNKRPENDDHGLLTISAEEENKRALDLADENLPAIMEDATVLDRVQNIPRITINYVLEFIKNPILLLMIIGALITYQREIRIWIGRHGGHRYMTPVLAGTDRKATPEITSSVDAVSQSTQDKPLDILGRDRADEIVPTKVEELLVTKTEAVSKVADVVKGDSSEEKLVDEANTPKKKKKAHRGVRGGVKHKKRTNSQDRSQDAKPLKKTEPTIDENVAEALKLGPQTKLEPDIRTIPSDPQEVSGPVIRIGALEVNTEKLIGTGSNGTMVFEGKFDGREVAVKRMLIQFFDIASQETKLLRESDDHPNVIRYFAQQQAAGFLYIALELCPASLADVIDKPYNHRELAQAGEKDLPNVLYQITNGLHHLHKLRIVHRDLKPQNILVSMGKDGKPRLLVSDFGLCKKLEGEQSSFRATTAHAAGTSGWRAPELLLDDDVKDGHHALVDASTDGNSGSIVLGQELPGNRRATRAIDIFSLGLVFFYVLTKGSHPFDCGDRFMREVNIRKGNYDLTALEVLGDYAYEAKDLIGSMLAAEPKQRPQAHQVMAHPFFWSPKKRLNFLCDVSDHFEKEKRDPPSDPLVELEFYAPSVCGSDFLRLLGKEFVESMGKQRKYTGTRLLDLLRALRNKKNHYEDMSDKLKKDVGPLPDGYLSFWTRRFPNLLISCWSIVFDVQWDDTDRFREYYLPAGL